MIQEKNILKRFFIHVLVFTFLLFAGIFVIQFNMTHQKNRYLDMQTNMLDTKYKTNYRYFKMMSKDIYTMYQDDKNLIDIINEAKDSNEIRKAELRDRLYAKLKKRYRRLKNMGVLQLHFHMPDNRSFLRMHKPKKFGDDLTNTRESIVLTNKTKKEHEGFEVGKVIHGFRFVYPLFNGKEHIGSMEVSFSSDKLRETVVDNFMVDSHFLVLKKDVYKHVWPEMIKNTYQASKESHHFLLESLTHHNPQNTDIENHILSDELQRTISEKMELGLAFSISNSYNHESIVGTFLPIKNVRSNKAVAYLVTYAESDHLDNLALEHEYIKVLFISVMFLLFMFSIYVTINRDRLREMAHFDKLTELPNRALFYIELEQELSRAKRLKNKLAVMFIDLDGFKGVNDAYGHNAGDQLLTEVAKRLKNSVRDGDLVSRLGGDEFTAVLTDIKSEEAALLVAEKIIKILRKDFIINKNIINIGASIGISIFPEHGKDSDTLMRYSDTAMYKAKENGKNCAVLYEIK